MSQRSVDPEKLKEFLQNRKKRSTAELVEVIEEGNDRQTAKAENAFGDLPEFENVAVPPVRRPLPATTLHAGTVAGLSGEKLAEVENLLRQVRVLGWICVLVLGLLVVIEMSKPIANLLRRTEYDYMVYDLTDETQHEIKDNLKIDGWELVTINLGSAIYKRPR